MASDRDRILLIRTGGTVDSAPYADAYAPPKFVETLKGPHSLVMSVAKQLPNGHHIDQRTWGPAYEDRFVKDSQQYTASDLRALAAMIRSDSHRCFVLTHGTDFMQKNAAALRKMLGGTDKTIVFVGAMKPLSMSSEEQPSDFVKALRFTLTHIARQPAGVYMVGKDSFTKRLGFFHPGDVRKDHAASRKPPLEFTLRVLGHREASFQAQGI